MENLLYIGILTGGDDGLFRSDDKGNSWTRITTKEMTHTVEALATSGRVLYAGTTGGGVFRSEDKGDTWITVNNGLTDQTVSALLAVSEDIVFVGTWGWRYFSDNGRREVLGGSEYGVDGDIRQGIRSCWTNNLRRNKSSAFLFN